MNANFTSRLSIKISYAKIGQCTLFPLLDFSALQVRSNLAYFVSVTVCCSITLQS